jgi:acyl carrier protein
MKERIVDDLEARVREIISVELQVDTARVHPGANLRRDLAMDSVAALNILFAAEETFGIAAIDVTELASVATVADVENLIRQHVAMLRAS